MEFKLKDDILTINGEAYKLVPVEEQQVQEEPTQEKQRTGWERVDWGEEHHFIDMKFNSCWARDEYSHYTDGMYEAGNYTNNEKLSNNIGRAVSIYLRMLRWQAENDEPVEIHNPDVAKWYIRYDMYNKELYEVYMKNYLATFDISFSSQEKAQECIRAFESDLIWLHTQFYHRLDRKGVEDAEM